METQIRKGDLLVASMSLADPNFSETVILVCQHDEQAGTYGLIMNRPIEVPNEVLEQFPFIEGRTFEGGPVQPEVVQVLHPYGDRFPQSLEVLPGLWLGGDFDMLRQALDAEEIDAGQCSFFLGYSGWSKDQLYDEFEMNAWLNVRGDVALILETPHDMLWTRTVQLYGKSNPMYTHYPDNPRTN